MLFSNDTSNRIRICNVSILISLVPDQNITLSKLLKNTLIAHHGLVE